MANISSEDMTRRKIFKAILDHGPITAYGVFAKLGHGNEEGSPSKTTVFRHFKGFAERETIMIYEKGKMNGIKKVNYGPTTKGLFFYSTVANVKEEKLEKILLKWMKNGIFANMMKDILGTTVLKMESSEQSKFLTRYMKYYSKCLEMFWEYDEERELPIQWQMELGQRLFSEKYPKENEKFSVEMWKKSPQFRQQVYDNLEEMENDVASFEKMDKSMDKISKNVETDHELWKKKVD